MTIGYEIEFKTKFYQTLNPTGSSDPELFFAPPSRLCVGFSDSSVVPSFPLFISLSDEDSVEVSDVAEDSAWAA